MKENIEITSKYIVYGLVDPRNNELRYVGQSSKGLKRPKQHWSTFSLNLKDHCHNWINSLIKENLIPVIEVLDEFDGDENNIEAAKNWLDTNEIFAISFYREQGCNLTNQTDGGGGSLGRVLSEETKQLIREARVQQGSPRLGTGKDLVEKECKYCQKTFKTKRENQLYCDRKCYITNGRSDEVKNNMSVGQTRRKEVICVEDGTIYVSEHAVAKALNITRSLVRYAIDKNKKINGKYYQHTNAPTQPKVRCVNDKLVFNNANSASKYYDIDYRYICRVLRCIQKTTMGLSFKYIGDKENG